MGVAPAGVDRAVSWGSAVIFGSGTDIHCCHSRRYRGPAGTGAGLAEGTLDRLPSLTPTAGPCPRTSSDTARSQRYQAVAVRVWVSALRCARSGGLGCVGGLGAVPRRDSMSGWLEEGLG